MKTRKELVETYFDNLLMDLDYDLYKYYREETSEEWEMAKLERIVLIRSLQAFAEDYNRLPPD